LSTDRSVPADDARDRLDSLPLFFIVGDQFSPWSNEEAPLLEERENRLRPASMEALALSRAKRRLQPLAGA
jgi:hypothetical protein